MTFKRVLEFRCPKLGGIEETQLNGKSLIHSPHACSCHTGIATWFLRSRENLNEARKLEPEFRKIQTALAAPIFSLINSYSEINMCGLGALH